MVQVLIISSALLWVVVLFNLLLTLALVRQRSASARSRDTSWLKVGQQAPQFTARTLDGKTVSLATYAGRPVTFLFISPDCEPCREGLPKYQALYPKAEQSGIQLVLVSLVDKKKTQGFVSKFNLQLPIIVAPQDNNPFMKDYKITETPSYCLLDVQGKVLSTGPSTEWGTWRALTSSWGTSEAPITSLMATEGR